MNLRKKILIFICLIAVTSLFLIFFFLNNILLQRFAQLDEEDVRSEMLQIMYAIEDELQIIKTNMLNFSAWDDTHQFIQSIKPDADPDYTYYIESNYPDNFYLSNHLHIVALYNTEQELVYGRSFDYELQQQTSIPNYVLETLTSNNNSLFSFNEPDDNHVGFMIMNGQPMLVVSLPIVTSEMTGPIMGTMIVGRMLDDFQVERINKRGTSEVRVETLINHKIPSPSQQPIWTHAGSSDNHLRVSSIINDIFGKPALIISTENERQVYLQGKQAVFNYALIMFVCFLLIYLIVTIFIKQFITDRIVKLIYNIRTINKKRDFSLRINSSGTDEFSELEREFNFMMNSLESARNSLKMQVLHDPLTTLPNRTFFYEKLESAMANASTGNEGLFAIFYIDLNNFKWVNDTWGHDHGDALLIEVACRLRQYAKSSDMMFRLGGDEFAVLLTNVKDKVDASAQAKEILECLSSSPFVLKGREFFISASIGVSMYPFDGDNPDKLVKHADIAMFHAKRSGIHLAIYSDELQAGIDRQALIEHHINYAVPNHSLVLHYQPIVEVASKRIIGIEALVRWQHPVLGLLHPSEFIPIAESTGAIIDIGHWVLHQACTDIRYLQQNGFPNLHVAVKFSVIQLEREHIVKEILTVLKNTGLQTDQLNLEITESATMSHDRAALNLQQLLDHGVRTSLDDFGTGYSSLSYLRRFPVHTIKIDRSFISEMSATNIDSTISKLIIDLGHSLNLKVIAEGVETHEQWTLLQHIGCDQIQGFFISKPLVLEDLLKLMIDHKTKNVLD